MSYEGRYQVICEDGHYDEIDAHVFCYTNSKCNVCQKKFIEVNAVDDTNSPSVGYDYSMEARAEKIRKQPKFTKDGSKILYSFKI